MISLIIVNYNLSGEILDCLDSIERNPPSLPFEIIVIDNGSTDDRRDELQQRINQRQRDRYEDLHDNRGFGAACNAGARLANGELLCFLNPDTLIRNDFLADLKRTRSAHHAVLVGPAYNKPGRFEFAAGTFPNLLLEFLQIFMISRHVEAWWMALRRRLNSGRPIDVDWVLGACLFIGRRQFENINGFDEDFFLYFEEMDLCRRLKESGARIVFDSNTIVHHIGSVSGKKDYAKFTARFYQGKIRYLNKHHQGLVGFLLLFCVRAQLVTQRLFWSLPILRNSSKASGKRQGVRDALVFYRQAIRT